MACEGQGGSEVPTEGQVDLRRSENIRRLAWQVLLVVVSILVGVVVLWDLEDLDVSETLYVVTQIVTTIGYGDITVQGDGERLFMAFYVLWVLVPVAFLLNGVIQRALDAQEDRVRQRLRQFEARWENRNGPDSNVQDEDVKKIFGKYNRLAIMMAIFVSHLLFGTFFFGLLERCTCSYGRLEKDSCTAETACESGYTLDFIESFYMSVVTLTTVGFGDFSPKSLAGRLIGIFWMVSGIISTAGFLEALQMVFFHVEEESKLDEADLINEKLFAQMDLNLDGALSENDFLHYCIVQERLMDPETIKRLKDLYSKIAGDDSDGITLRDMQKYKVRRARRRTVAERAIKNTGCVTT